MLNQLLPAERLLLLKFVCAFAWADLEIQDAERKFIVRLLTKLELDAEESQRVEEWLRYGVPADAVDPNRIPRQHRQLFLDYAEAIVSADGQVDPTEAENLELLRQLLE